MARRFSRSFQTFGEWLSQSQDTSYSQRIKRLHNLHPKASLSQLRSHARKGEKTLGQLGRVSPSRIQWDNLVPREMEIRERSLKVLSKMRNEGWSLSKASRHEGISPETVIRHTEALKKEGPYWIPKTYDTISRQMTINENGRSIWIEVKDSRNASTIGRYHNAVRSYLETGDESYLKPFHGKRIKDSDGNWHILETDPYKLHEIKERQPNEEFTEIYKTRDD